MLQEFSCNNILNKSIKVKKEILESNPFQSRYGRVIDLQKGGLALVQWDTGDKGFIHINNIEVR
jgi:hypothetical protein